MDGAYREQSETLLKGSGMMSSLLGQELPWDRQTLSAPGLQTNELGNRRFSLAQTIESEVIPHLLKLRDAGTRGSFLLGVEIEEFALLLLKRNSESASAIVERLQGRAVPIETIYLDLLAPAARSLGDRWTEDLCSFQEVTLGLGRLNQIMHGAATAFRSAMGGSFSGHRVLMMPAPGENHTFGVSMVAEFFRSAGWSVRSGPRTSAGDLAASVRRDWFDIVGISVGSELRLGAVATAISVMRRVSKNPRLIVMVGGPAFFEHPEAVAEVGADATASDGRQAVIQAEALLAHAIV